MMQQKNDSIVSFIKTVLKKSAELPDDVMSLADSVKTLADQCTQIAKNTSHLFKIVQEHDKLLMQLIAVQTYLLANTKTTGIDTQLPDIDKEKSDKPN